MNEKEFIEKLERAFSEYIYDKFSAFDEPKKIYARIYSPDDKVYEMVVHVHRNYDEEYLLKKTIGKADYVKFLTKKQ